MLDIFPQGALDSSVITTVWLGLSVIAILNLRFGTTLSGLVVPGYLVPLFLVKPMAAWTTIGEGLLTYALANILARQLFRWTGANEMFGRDRFFAIVFLSIVVRSISDAYLLPGAGAWLTQHGYPIDYQFELHSFGLVVVALIANQMWNGGWRTGCFALTLYTGITFLLVRYVLMNFTNFSIGNLGYMYEDIATSILASPKAYMILLVTAYIASRLNLHYGWEFNGIMLPALLALQWYQPMKLAATLVEAVVIFLLARQLLRLPWFAKRNMEGARLLLLFFNVGFAYKIAVGFVLPHWWPGIKVSDYYAFGYLLSTLLAMKMHQKDIAIRLTRATVQTSLMGLAAASVLGFALTLILPPTVSASSTNSTLTLGNNRSASERWAAIKTAIYASESESGGTLPNTFELAAFESGTRALARFTETQDNHDWQESVGAFASIDYTLDAVGDVLYLQDRQPHRGWGFYALRQHTSSTLLLEIPAALDERSVLDAGITLFDQEQCRAIAIAGARRNRHLDGRMDVLRHAQLPFQIFHRVFAQQTLQLRVDWTRAENDDSSDLWIKRQLPGDIVIGEWQRLSGDIHLQWQLRDATNLQASSQVDQFAEWVMSPATARRLIARSIAVKWQDETVSTVNLSGYLYSTLLESKQRIAGAGSNNYQSAELNQLLFANDEILQPLLLTLQRESSWPFSETGAQQLQQIAAQAAVLNYELVHLRHDDAKHDYVILRERGTEHGRSITPRYWGTYVFAVGAQMNAAIEVPRPLSEPQTFGFATSWFENNQAHALLLAGAHEDSNSEHLADVLLSNNKLTLFNLVHQSLLRSANAPLMILQARGIATDFADQMNHQDAWLSYREQLPRAVSSDLAAQMEQTLSNAGLSVARIGERWESGRYTSVSNAQARFISSSRWADMAVLWLAPTLKDSYRNQIDSNAENLKFAALAINTETASVRTVLQQSAWLSVSDAEQQNLRMLLQDYLQTRDIVSLQRTVNLTGLRFRRVIDVNSGIAYLFCYQGRGLVAVLNLSSARDKTLDRSQIEAYLQQRDRWLFATGVAP